MSVTSFARFRENGSAITSLWVISSFMQAISGRIIDNLDNYYQDYVRKLFKCRALAGGAFAFGFTFIAA